MDIEYFKTHRLNFGSNTKIGAADISARIFYTDIDHRMNNYQLRDPAGHVDAAAAAFPGHRTARDVDVESDALGFSLKSNFSVGRGELGMGVDGNFEEHSGIVHDPDVPGPMPPEFFVENFNNASSGQPRCLCRVLFGPR